MVGLPWAALLQPEAVEEFWIEAWEGGGCGEVRMGRIVGGPYSTNKNLTALSAENLIDTFSYTPGVHGPYTQASKALPARWKEKQLATTTPKGSASSCSYGGTVMGNALFVRASRQRAVYVRKRPPRR